MMAAPAQLTSKTMEYLRSEGFVVDKTERQSPRFAPPPLPCPDCGAEQPKPARPTFILDRKKDLFEGIDLVAMRDDVGIIGIQVTDASNLAARRKKIFSIPELWLWVRHGRLWIISWRKVTDPPGSKRQIWKPKIEKLTPEVFAEAVGDRMQREWRRLARA